MMNEFEWERIDNKLVNIINDEVRDQKVDLNKDLGWLHISN